MKIVLKDVNSIFEIKSDCLNSIVIENPRLMYTVINELKKQCEKNDGDCVLSENNEVMDISKSVELVTTPFEIDVNAKAIINKVVDLAANAAMNEMFFEKTMKIMSEWERYIDQVLFYIDCNAQCGGMQIKQIIKASEIRIEDKCENLEERLYDYVEVVSSLLGKKLLIFVNIRGYIEEEKFNLMSETLIQHDYRCLFIDSFAGNKAKNENRLTIDIDLCEF